MITLFLGDFSQVKIIDERIFQIVVWTIGIGILLWGVVLFVIGWKLPYSAENLYDEICEIDPFVEHTFNIVLLKNSQLDGKYLLFKNKRWRALHFPNYKAKSNPYNFEKEIERVRCSFASEMGIDQSEKLDIKFIGDITDRKYSRGDRKYKKFHFYFYEVSTEHSFPKIPWLNRVRPFKFNGKKFVWLTLDNMYKDRNIVKTNEKVLDFVRNTCDVS